MTQHPNTVFAASNPSTDLATLDMEFNEYDGDQVIKPTLQNNPRLQWFNGLTTTTFETAVGFHIEADVNPLLDETLAAMGVKRYIVQHKTTNQDGQAKQLPYWALNWGAQPCSLFILSYGIKSKYEMNKDVNDRCGIAYGWEVVKDREGNIVKKKGSDEPKHQCRLQFHAFVHELVRNGFSEWFQVSFNGIITENVLTALNEQFRVIEVYNSYARSKGGNPAPFYGFSLPFLPGPVKMVGPKDGDQSPIYPPVAQVPEQITGSYLLEHLISKELKTQIVENDLLSDALLWSIQRSQEICGESASAKADEASAQASTTVTVDATAAPATDAAVPVVASAPSAPQLPPAQDRPVNQTELTWIANGYCVGNKGFLKQVCERFGVAEPTQLRYGHYAILQQESANYSQPAN